MLSEKRIEEMYKRHKFDDSRVRILDNPNLSSSQRKALTKLAKIVTSGRREDWVTAYRLQIGLGTLYALRLKGCIDVKGSGEVGAFSNPRVMLYWKVTDYGLYCYYHYRGKR